MSYINFKGMIKRSAMKGDEVEVVLSIPSQHLRGQFESLNDMIECQIVGGFDSQVVKFNKLLDARTNKPLKQYKVDDRGFVSEVKPEGEQLTMDSQLGISPEQVEVKEEPVVIDLAIINRFILSGMAPRFEDLDHDFVRITERIAAGDTYTKIANDEGVALVLLNMALDEYRQRIAPLAIKWDEWRQTKDQSKAPIEKEEEDLDDAIDEDDNESVEDDREEDPESEQEESNEEHYSHPLNPEDELSDWEREILDGNEPQVSRDEPVDLDTFILTQKPKFPEIEFDFPSLLERKKSGSTWMEIASSLHVTSGQLSAAWSKYRKLVEKMRDNGAA